jgi:hypothetical protein
LPTATERGIPVAAEARAEVEHVALEALQLIVV